jgi:DNA-binding transcriptional regulator YiaG
MLSKEGTYIVTPAQAKKIRFSLKWSVARLAAYMMVTEDTVRKWERGYNVIKGPAVIGYRVLKRKAEKKKLALSTPAK